MTLASQVAALATRVAQEIKAVRAEMALISGGSDPWTYVHSTVDSVNTSDTNNVDVAGLVIPTSLVPGVYEVEARVIAASVATTTAVRLGFFWPVQADMMVLWQTPNGGASTTFLHQITSLVFTAGTSWPTASTKGSLATASAFLRVNSTMAQPIVMRVRSEIAASEVRTLAGSYMRYRRIS